MDIFNWFGSILGYCLWFFYEIFKNYGVAIIIFSLIVKVLMFPLSIKQQKSMAANSKIMAKQKELQAKYANNKLKLQEETQKLYEKENMSPTSGCLTSLLPFPIMIGLFYTVQQPLANALHLSAEAITKATTLLSQIPGIGSTFSSQYAQMEIVKHFAELKPYLTMFNGDELARMESFSHGFTFCGLDLLGTPNTSAFSTMLWLIPVLSLVTSLLSQIYMMKVQPGMNQQQGCMKYMFYILPLFTAWIAYTVPAAVGFYWVVNTVLGFFQTLIMKKFYSPELLTAQAEAKRIALREEEEARVEELPVYVQKQIEAKTNSQPQAQQKQQNASKQQKKQAKPSKSNSDAYRGTKK